MKKHQTIKHRKASKSARIARMQARTANREQHRKVRIVPSAPPMSLARRAFQDA